MSKLVSIVSPCYNGEKYIENYLDSVLNQTYSKIELIFVDDGSTDGTERIVQQYIPMFEKKGYSLIYHKHIENKGQAAAINFGLKIFSGEYFTWMDSDDIYYPNAIEEKVRYLENYLEFDFVINQGEIVDEDDLNKPIGILKRQKPQGKDCLFQDYIDEHNVFFCPGGICVRAKVIKQAIPKLAIFESREGQNFQLLLPLAYSFKWGYLDKVLFKYVVHSDSHSHLKRIYEEEIERRNRFYILMKETINQIPGISDEEKNQWIKYAFDRQLKVKYIISLDYRKRKEFLCYRKKIKERNLDLPINIPYVLYPIYISVGHIKDKLRKMLSR